MHLECSFSLWIGLDLSCSKQWKRCAGIIFTERFPLLLSLTRPSPLYDTQSYLVHFLYWCVCRLSLLFLKKKILQIVAELLHERLLLEIIFLFFLPIGFLINILHWQVNVNKALIINQRCCFWLWWNRMDPTASLM